MERFCPDCKTIMVKLEEVKETDEIKFIYACNDGENCNHPIVYIIYRKED